MIKREVNCINPNAPKEQMFMLDKIPPNIVEAISKQILKIKNDIENAEKVNPTLAGQIDKEFSVPNIPELMPYLNSLSKEFLKKTFLQEKDINKFHPRSLFNPNFVLEQTWVNFQKKYEYNPPHRHTGLLSFVIWHQIPYFKKDEIEVGPGKDKSNKDLLPKYMKEALKRGEYTIQDNLNGDFSFLATDFRGELINYSIPVDKRMENHICIFPSSLYHQVFPFYSSNDYRITLSGNIFYNVKSFNNKK